MMRSLLFVIALAVSFSVGAQTQDQLEKIQKIEQLLTELAASCTGTIPTPLPPTEPPATTQPPWECYLARYADVRNAGPYTAQWAWRHYSTWGRSERRCWFCEGDERQEAWCQEEEGGDTGDQKSVGAGFIWKPVSETDGKLVVIFPRSFSPAPTYVNGEAGNYIGRHNGDKIHYRFNKPGSGYPEGVKLRYGDDEWCVKSPGSRHENSLWQCALGD